MKKIVLFFAVGLMVLSCNPRTEQINSAKNMSANDSVRDGVFIHITESYNDPHKVLMPMKMALMMSNDKDVLIYLDIHAVQLLAKNAKDMNYADFESFQTYVKKLSKNNVGIYACPTCLKIAGIAPENLLEGVRVAEKSKFFNFTKGRIITLDY